MDKSSNQVNGNVNPNQQPNSSSTSNRNQNHNHQSHPHPQNYSYNQHNSSNPAWSLHPSFGAAFNHPSTSAPAHQSYNSYAGSYRSPSSNLSWNRGQEARGAVGGSIDKGKGKAPANQAAHPTQQVRPRPRPLPKKIPTRTEDMQPNELKTDFVYRNFIASNRPPVVKDSKKITSPNPVRPSQSPSTSSASTSSSKSFRPPTGPRPKHNLPNRPTPNINNHNSSNSRSPQKQFSTPSFLNRSGNSAADPQYIDVDEISTNGNGKQPKQKQQKKGKGKGKGKAKEPPQQVRVSENGTGEVLSKKAAKRRRKEMREMAKEASTSTIPTPNTSTTTTTTTTSSTNPNLTTLQNNRWGALQSNSSSSNVQSSVNDSTSSEVNKIEVDLSQSLQVRQTSRSPPAASMKMLLETSTPAIAPEDDSLESEAESVRVVETTTTQPIDKIDSREVQKSSTMVETGSEESELESPIRSVRNLKRKATTPPPSSTSKSSPPPYPANGAALSRDELEKEVKRIKPFQDQTSFVSAVKTSAAESLASVGPLEAGLSKSSQPDIGIGMVTRRNQDEVMENRSDADNSVQKQDQIEKPSQSTQPIQMSRESSSSTASSALPSSSSVQVSNPTAKPLVVASNRSTKVPIVKPVRPGPRKETTSPSNFTKQNGVSSLSDQSAQVQFKSEPSASTSTSTSQAHTLNSAARPPSPSRSTFKVKTEPIDVDEIESAEVIILDSDSDDDLPLADLRSRSKGAMSTNTRNGLELLPSMGAFNYDTSGGASSSGSVNDAAVTSREPSKKSKPKMKISGLGESRLSAQLDPSHHPRFLLPISSKGYGSQDKSGKDFDSFLVLSRFGHASSSRSDAKFFGEPTPIFPSRSFSNRIEEVQRVSSLCVAVASSCQQAVHGEQPPQLTLLFARDPPARDADAELDGSKRKWFATDELEVSPIRHLDSKPHTFGASCLSFFPGQQDESDGGASGDLDLATGGSDGVVFRWTFNSKSRTNGKALPQDRTSRIHALHVSTNSAKATGVKALTDLKRCNSLVSAGTDGKVLIYDVDKQMEKGRWKTDDNLVSLKKCPSPHLFMSAQSRTNYDQFKCFDIRQGSKVSKPALSFGWQALKAPSNLSRGSFNPVHKSLYSHPSPEGTVRLWDLRMPKEDPLEIVVSLEKEIYDVGWSKDGRDLVSLCSDGIRKTEVMMGPR